MNQIIIELNLLTIIELLSIATSFILALLFITIRSKNKKANIFLGLFLWSLSIEVFDAFIPLDEVFLFNFPKSSLFTIPFLFLYINQTFNRKIFWFYFLLFIPGFFFLSTTVNITIIKYLEYIFNIFILIYALIIVKNYQNKLTDFYSDLENKTLLWIQTILYIYLFFHLFWIIEDMVGSQNQELIEYFVNISNVLTFFMIYWIGYNGFSQSEIFKYSLFLNEEKELIVINDLSETAGIFNEIILKIETEKLFSNTNINLRILANQLGLKEKELSVLINKHTNNNFYYFINHFRIVEFKKLLKSPKAKQLSILGMATEAGFASKSTFYAAFKKIENMTPKQYQNQLNKSE
ncbi:helix-turn-helix domain-containing protein [Tenacibaculum pacificus]|uniref:helix-turn-helix domain-containing protein n=1 Tax=Tenacibaculum pacificus TaxID=3018314 RepID=UPI0022F3C959|nr:helix-turn-helix domain-containing protein [Tenacibaculum pacificus]WBX73639.1 helix-turn-helix domain-containing protein [Tenacibaculum pacificus]